MRKEETIDVEFSVNGNMVKQSVGLKTSLLRVLRDDLGLIGTKEGCTTGDCGTCVVLVDGKPVDSCLHLARRTNGCQVETIEGLARSGQPLHPLQAAFLECGAVQCGFCIPGMIMASKALLATNPSPQEPEIKEALTDVICRCTGYTQIIEAVQLAAKWLASPTEYAKWTPRFGPMGTSMVLVDGEQSVKGELIFADDMVRERMLHGQIVWSQHPHARIVRLDTTGAGQAPGVVKVVTAADVPGLNAHGRTRPDLPVFCTDRVRFTGDIVALVVAESKNEAIEGAKLVEVDYEPLQGVYSIEDSLREDAPKLHPDGNICKHLVHTKGDVETALQDAAHIVEGHFETQRVDHAYLEPQVSIAEVSNDGTVTIYTPSQAPFETREQLVKILNRPRDKVRIVATPLGGGFGAKLEINVEAVAAVAALATNRPVKITLSREENLHSGVKRHPYKMDYRVGADKDGRLLAVDAQLFSDAGPYTGNSPRVIDQACIFSCGPYVVPNVRVEGTMVFTNNANGGAFRGYGINQAAVAMEQLMDELARKLEMDPFEIRRINMLKEGDETITGQLLPSSVGAIPTVEAARRAFEEEWPEYQKRLRPGVRLGYGVASAYKNVGAGKGKIDDSGATFTLLPNGRIELRVSVIDMGQAIRTCMLQLAAESTGLDPRCFDLVTGDTELTHPHRSASGQRQTLISGNAVVMAGKAFKEKLLDAVAGWSGIPVSDLDVAKGEVRTQWSQYRNEATVMTLAQAAAKARERMETISAEAEYVAPTTYPLSDVEAKKRVPRDQYRNYPTYSYATQVALVEVEEATGEVKVVRVIAAHDVGKIINPQQIRGQLVGSIVMMQGYTLTEDYPLKEGRPLQRHVTFGRLGLPLSTDIPTVRLEIVENPFPEGPFGAKGISEIATVPSPPAILNAIYDATRVRVRALPVNPDELKRAMNPS